MATGSRRSITPQQKLLGKNGNGICSEMSGGLETREGVQEGEACPGPRGGKGSRRRGGPLPSHSLMFSLKNYSGKDRNET